MRPLGKHARNRAIHRLGITARDRMEARNVANPDLIRIRRCTVEHPFGTIKRMPGGGRFTCVLKRVKAEAALSFLAFNILRATNAVGTEKLTAPAEAVRAFARR